MTEPLKAMDFVVPKSDDGQLIPLARALKNVLPDMSWNKVRDMCATGKVRVDGMPARDSRHQIDGGVRIQVDPNAPNKPEKARFARKLLTILFEDTQLLVIDKPAGVSTVPFEAGERSTVLDLVRKTWRAHGTTNPRTALRVVHRLDRNTSGVMVLAKTEETRSMLAAMFRTHSLERNYVAVIQGDFRDEHRRIFSFIATDRGDGLRGSVKPPLRGKEAVTHVERLEALEGATLVRCILESGRTHQIRIHLSEAGHPVLGETAYIRDHEGPLLKAPRLALHATYLGFRHPGTGRFLHFDAELPQDLVDLITSLGGSGQLPPRERRERDQSHSPHRGGADRGRSGQTPRGGSDGPRGGHARSNRRDGEQRGQQQRGRHAVKNWWQDGEEEKQIGRDKPRGTRRQEGGSGQEDRGGHRWAGTSQSRGPANQSRGPAKPFRRKPGGDNDGRGTQTRPGRSGWEEPESKGGTQSNATGSAKSNTRRRTARPPQVQTPSLEAEKRKKLEKLEGDFGAMRNNAMKKKGEEQD